MSAVLQPTQEEIVQLGAADGIYYSHQFFPKTFRQTTPPIHRIVWDEMDDPHNQFLALELFRGSGKTTVMRGHVSKRIAYGVSRTIMLVGPEQKHPKRSIRWLQRQIEVNDYWTSTFGLYKGAKWSEEEIEIINESAECRIFVIAFGLTGSIRGLNLDDYRPDFIGVDDPCDEENTGTEAQRDKTEALFFGNLQQSLAPRSEAPHAKMVLLQTGLHKKDLIHLAHKDPTWKTIKLGIFDKNKESVWEERFPTVDLHEKKKAFIERDQLRFWLREMECKIVSAETAAFNVKFLKHYEQLPAAMQVFAGIDPARETKLQTKAHKGAIVMIGLHRGIRYWLEHWAAKDPNPEIFWQQFLRLAMKWRPTMTGIESHAYQQTLAWYFNRRMIQTQTAFTLTEYSDRRKKPDRIRQAFTQPIVLGTFQTRKDDTETNEALQEYSDDVDIDILDAGAIAMDISTPWLQESMTGDGQIEALLPQGYEAETKDFIEPCP